MSDSRQKSVDALREEVAQLRDALRNLRESVVLRVMYRDKLQEEVTRLKKGVSDMENGIALAERANDPELAEKCRQEKAVRFADMEQFEARLQEAVAQAEAAKIRLPEDEATLLRQLNDLQAQALRATATQVEANLPGGFGTDADNLWERASNKIADLKREASARQEVSGIPRPGASAGESGGTQSPSRLSPDESAEQMLLALEAKMAAGASPLASVASATPAKPATPVVPITAPPSEPGSEISNRARYLEFDPPTPVATTGDEVTEVTTETTETTGVNPATAANPSVETTPADQATPDSSKPETENVPGSSISKL